MSAFLLDCDSDTNIAQAIGYSSASDVDRRNGLVPRSRRRRALSRFHFRLKTPFRPVDLLGVALFEEEYLETRTSILGEVFSRLSCHGDLSMLET